MGILENKRERERESGTYREKYGGEQWSDALVANKLLLLQQLWVAVY